MIFQSSDHYVLIFDQIEITPVYCSGQKKKRKLRIPILSIQLAKDVHGNSIYIMYTLNY